ncbi:energy transducer TonB [Saccharobesus litoralis]|uniref:Energy transducer TonB n=1 Tax=Saccharobesus litoralis TaxID=2172099 RepID=A0A2S0VUR8_9ALTE|nr:MotA/TolQ/ExbB proton channel family protein [Saccharobesus litoralis]AWB67912.1 energy transducer TonB [Saccharobesus litoralis]
MLKSIAKSLVIASAFAASLQVNAEPVNLDELLKTLEQGKMFQSQENQRREAEFKAQRDQQVRLLNEARNERDNQIKLSEKLETQFEENEFKTADLQEALDKRMGSLKELFGVLQQVAGDAKNKFSTSLISAQYAGRDVVMDELAQKMGKSSKLASIEEIEQVWFALQREMTESGKVATFNAPVVLQSGDKVEKEVVRVGAFNLVADGKYLEYVTETGTLAELSRQPSERFLAGAANIQTGNGELVQFALDPTGGSILGLLVQAPDLKERVEQGGTVGYIILAVGLVGLLIALIRFVGLAVVGAKMHSQLKSDVAKDNNPLGRVMKVKDDNPDADVEALELKLSEAILREVPKLSRFLTFIKIISVVAPLMGLLGTVTGMINTFQAITLFGTGDPKLMAGGISQALVTTVLGLVVAIPTVLIYTVLNTRSKNLIYILQEQSAGIIAERSEKGA